MRKTLLAAAAAFVIGGATVGALVSHAQPAPPPPRRRLMGRGGRTLAGWVGCTGCARAAGRWRLRTFALVYRQDDRNLTPPDVQKIAEAFLLWKRQSHLEGGRRRGDVRWRDRLLAGDAGGLGIARFTMDPHTGRVTRTG